MFLKKHNMVRKFNNPLYFPIMKKLYYPGSGKDLDTLKLILSEFKFVEDIVFSDYILHLSTNELQTLEHWELIKVIPLTPGFFRKDSWEEFWYPDDRSRSFAEPNQIDSTLHVLFHKKTHKIVRFYQLGTEGVGTYKVLSRCGLRPNLIFLVDHDFVDNWDPNIWGEPSVNSGQISFLKSEAFRNRFIMVDKKTTYPWSDYQIDPNFHHERWSLFKREELVPRKNKLQSDRKISINTTKPHPGIDPRPEIKPAPSGSIYFFDQGNKE